MTLILPILPAVPGLAQDGGGPDLQVTHRFRPGAAGTTTANHPETYQRP
jgi:hypothetical protein